MLHRSNFSTPPCIELASPVDLPIYHVGPSQEAGPLPSVFYFSLSGPDSLEREPYCQPVIFLAEKKFRIFSFTLPAHGPGYDDKDAMSFWANDVSIGLNRIAEFVEQSLVNIDYLIAQGWVDAQRVAVAGLSRGGFIAAHIAAQSASIQTVLAYAPLVSLEILDEFHALQEHPLVHKLALKRIIPQLIHKSLRFYIGNRDTRVSTDTCYHFIRDLTEEAYRQGVRSPQVSLVVSPSVGHRGHGTLLPIFEDGINWLCKQLEK